MNEDISFEDWYEPVDENFEEGLKKIPGLTVVKETDNDGEAKFFISLTTTQLSVCFNVSIVLDMETHDSDNDRGPFDADGFFDQDLY